MSPDGAAFRRWATLLWRRVTLTDVSPDLLAWCWCRAQREIAARVALSAAREGWIDAKTHEHGIDLAGTLSVPLQRKGAFALHRADPGADRHPTLEDAVATWRWIVAGHGLDESTRERVAAEVADSAFNLALAHAAAALKHRSASLRPRDVRLCDGEHLVVEGHPWHPMTKTRLGLTTAENLRLAPEVFACGPVRAVDVRENLVRRSDAFTDVVAPMFGEAPPGWIRLPVHAAQRARLPRRLGAIWGRDVRDATVPARRGRALLSLRTIAFDAAGRHLKLALDVHTTSARRLVSPMSVHNGPRITSLLESVQARDPLTGGDGRLRIVGDRWAAGLEPQYVGPCARQLGIIIRDARDFAAPDGAASTVCAALGSEQPGHGDLPLETMAAAYPGDAPARGLALLAEYVERLAPPLLRLCTAHGIALEPHLQNTLVLTRGNRPVGFVVRDLGGIRLHRERLRDGGHQIELEPDSFIVTDTLSELQNKLAHCLVHAHLGTLVGWLQDRLAVPPDRAWSTIRRCFVACWDAWSADPALQPACAEDRATFLAPRVRAKALFTMRIHDRSSDYDYIVVDNPLGS